MAGHETTSALLNFVIYYLLKYPDVYRKLQQEVDSVLGQDPIQPEHLSKLPYVVGMPLLTVRCQSSERFTVVQRCYEKRYASPQPSQ